MQSYAGRNVEWVAIGVDHVGFDVLMRYEARVRVGDRTRQNHQGHGLRGIGSLPQSNWRTHRIAGRGSPQVAAVTASPRGGRREGGAKTPVRRPIVGRSAADSAAGASDPRSGYRGSAKGQARSAANPEGIASGEVRCRSRRRSERPSGEIGHGAFRPNSCRDFG